MCGIVYSIRFSGNPVAKKIRKQYYRQCERGKQGFGYVSVSLEGRVKEYARATTEDEIMKKLKADSSHEIMFHHRFPTSTPNFEEAAHPIFVSNPLLRYDYYVVHNGVITNDDELKEKHDALGYKYTTEVKQQWVGKKGVISETVKYNDSEALAIEIARDLDGEKKGLTACKGSIAFICMQVLKGKNEVVKTYFGRNTSNPLKYNLVDGAYLLVSSTGEGKDCFPDYLYELDYETQTVESKYYCIGSGYSHIAGYGTKWPKDWDKDEDDYTPALLPGATVSKEEEEADDKYYELLDEQYTLEDDLKDDSIMEWERSKITERLEDIKKQLTALDEAYMQSRLK